MNCLNCPYRFSCVGAKSLCYRPNPDCYPQPYIPWQPYPLTPNPYVPQYPPYWITWGDSTGGQ